MKIESMKRKRSSCCVVYMDLATIALECMFYFFYNFKVELLIWFM